MCESRELQELRAERIKVIREMFLLRKEIDQMTIIMRFGDKWAECSGKHLTAAVMNVTRKLPPIALFERIVKLGKETTEDMTCD